MSQAAWYVVHTYSGYENKVKETIEKVVENRKLQHLIQEIRIPIEQVTSIVDGEEKTSDVKIFPGYVLIKMICNDDSWYVVRNTRGVTGFVGPGSEPTPLSEKEVLALGVDVSSLRVDFKVGDYVRVTRGNIVGNVCEVLSIDLEEKRVEILVNMFGRDTPTTLPLSDVEKMDD